MKEENILEKAKNIHFIGIGGIGISAIARMMLQDGKKVSGSDVSESLTTKTLSELGANIKIGHAKKNIPKKVDLFIYTTAISSENEEFVEAKNRKVKILTYPESLREISKNKFTIAISGTHGKTTTTAMIAKIMIDAGLDPTVIVGSFLKEFNSNFILGKSKYLVVEACEYRKSFLNIKPTIALITNIDNDHLDFYKDILDIQCAFREFASQVYDGGHLITDINNDIVYSVLKDLKRNIVDSSNFYSKKIKLKVPGDHNRKNASLALAVAYLLGIDNRKAVDSLRKFSGTWRRFEYKGKTEKGTLVYDDYGHHPTEIMATLSGAREFFGKKKIHVVFQPHLYSRTKILLDDFAQVFKHVDHLLVAPIYAAREKHDPTISSKILVDEIKKIPANIKTKAKSFDSFDEIKEHLSKNLKKNHVLMTIDAGDVYKIGEDMLKK